MAEPRFPLTDEMPCAPWNITFRSFYSYPSMLGNAEMEEAAARVLAYSFRESVWRGVPWMEIQKDLQKDLEILREVDLVNHHNRVEWDRLRAAQAKRVVLSVLTLGIYTLATPSLVPNFKVRPNFVPITVIGLMGPYAIYQGLLGLREKGLLRMESWHPGGEVFFPTPLLVRTVRQWQRDR